MFLHRAAVLAETGVAVVFGGSNTHAYFNEAYAVTLGPCTRRSISGAISGAPLRVPPGVPLDMRVQRLDIEGARPEPRSAASLAAVDCAGRTALVLFGGSGRWGDFFDDTWTVTLTGGDSDQARAAESSHAAEAAEPLGRAAFEHVSMHSRASPAARWGHTAVGFGGKMWLFGGTCPGAAFNDLWCYDLADSQWTEIKVRAGYDLGAGAVTTATTGAGAVADVGPTPVSWGTMGDDDDDDHGGSGGGGSSSSGGGGGGGSDGAVGGAAMFPLGRGGHAAAIVNGRLYVHGGNTVEASFGDCWRVDLRACSGAVDKARKRRAAREPTASPGPAATHDPPTMPTLGVSEEDEDDDEEGEGGEVFYDAQEGHGDDFPWSGGESGAYEDEDDEVDDDAAAPAAPARLEVPGLVWERLPGGGPPPRIGHVAVAVGRNRLLIYGGRDFINGVFQPGVHLLNTDTLAWTQPAVEPYADSVVTDQHPARRTGHVAVPHEAGVVFLGGLGDKADVARQLRLQQVLRLRRERAGQSADHAPPALGSTGAPFPLDPAIFLDLTAPGDSDSDGD